MSAPTETAADGVLRNGVRLAAAAGVLGALVAMMQPLALSSVDHGGQPIPCGSGFHAVHDVSAALDRFNLEQHTLGGSVFVATDYTGQCDELVAYRRAASAVSAAIGGATLTAMAVLSARRRRTHLSAPSPIPQSAGYSAVDVPWDRTRVTGAFTSMSSFGHNEIR